MTDPSGEILIRGRDRIGDVVVTFPALKLLRSNLPGARLTYVCSRYAEELVRVSGLVDRVIPLRPGGVAFNLPAYLRLRREVRSGRFARIYLFEGAEEYGRWIGPLADARRTVRKDAIHAAAAYAGTVLESLGLDPAASIPSPRLEVADRPEITARLASLGLGAPGDSYMVVHPGSYRSLRRGAKVRQQKPDKRWPLEKFREVVERVLDRFPGLRVVLVGAGNEKRWVAEEFRAVVLRTEAGRSRVVDLTARTGLGEALQILKHAALLLSNDSGLMHLATVTGTPLVALFGPTDERMSGPFGLGDKARLVRATPLAEARTTPGCMDRLGVEEVFAAVESRLREIHAGRPGFP